MGGNEGNDGPGNEADRLLNFFPGAQAIGADDIDLRFGFVGLAAFNNLRKAGARHAAEIAPGHDHEVRVESLFGANSRLVSLDDRGVSFRYKDYRRNGQARFRTMTLKADEFIRVAPNRA